VLLVVLPSPTTGCSRARQRQQPLLHRARDRHRQQPAHREQGITDGNNLFIAYGEPGGGAGFQSSAVRVARTGVDHLPGAQAAGPRQQGPGHGAAGSRRRVEVDAPACGPCIWGHPRERTDPRWPPAGASSRKIRVDPQTVPGARGADGGSARATSPTSSLVSSRRMGECGPSGVKISLQRGRAKHRRTSPGHPRLKRVR
jgi:hypothetical protein